MTDKPLRELIAQQIDKAKMADIVDGRFSSEPYADSILSLIAERAKAIENPYKIFSHGYGNGFESCRQAVLKLLEK